MKYTWLVVIVREGAPEVTGFDNHKDAYDYFDRHGAQWSESYLCEVILGPKV